jgi:nitric oxide reductase large subunit
LEQKRGRQEFSCLFPFQPKQKGEPVKHSILIFFVVILIAAHSHAGWFNKGEQKEKERREYAEQQLAQAQHKNDGLGIVVAVLSVGVITSLAIGAAVGSKTRRAARKS